ncbi:MAG: response regulator transcription factor [Candidatus Binatia bacterium]
MGSITIVLADDYPIVRQGIRALFDKQEGFEVVGEADDGLEALRLVETLKPTVLVTDLTMPSLNGLEVARQITRRRLKTRILVLSMHSDEHYVLQALKNGAAGYVLKGCGFAELVRAIRVVVRGERYLPTPYSHAAIEAYLESPKRSNGDPYENLTNREREVLQLAAEGLSNTEIGGRLFISVRTVEVHRSHLMHKLSLRSPADLVRYAFEKGLLLPQRSQGKSREQGAWSERSEVRSQRSARAKG